MPSPQLSPSHHQSVLPSIIALLVFSALGFYSAQTQAMTNLPQAPDPTILSSRNFIPHQEKFVFFFTKAILNRTLTQVTLPFIPQDPAPLLFLGFTPENEQDRQEILFSHPQLNQLEWSSIHQDNQIFLYQKSLQFNSIAEFLTSPPPISLVATDPYLSRLYPQLSSAALTNQLLDLSQIEYIFTTYARPLPQHDYFLLQRQIDISTAKINENQEIEWFIKNTSPEPDSTYLLGNINVEFIQ